eukprot:1159109-Pelagomonas_calceolata.AAC.13
MKNMLGWPSFQPNVPIRSQGWEVSDSVPAGKLTFAAKTWECLEGDLSSSLPSVKQMLSASVVGNSHAAVSSGMPG